mgnify:CR=1 FL=1
MVGNAINYVVNEMPADKRNEMLRKAAGDVRTYENIASILVPV